MSVGRDPYLTKSIIEGDPPDGYAPDGIWVEDIVYDNDVVDDAHDLPAGDVHEDVREHVPSHADVSEDAAPLDEFHDVQRQVMDAFDRGDALYMDAAGQPIVLENDELDNDTMDVMRRLYHY